MGHTIISSSQNITSADTVGGIGFVYKSIDLAEVVGLITSITICLPCVFLWRARIGQGDTSMKHFS